jgi:hypothetical protein
MVSALFLSLKMDLLFLSLNPLSLALNMTPNGAHILNFPFESNVYLWFIRVLKEFLKFIFALVGSIKYCEWNKCVLSGAELVFA